MTEYKNTSLYNEKDGTLLLYRQHLIPQSTFQI